MLLTLVSVSWLHDAADRAAAVAHVLAWVCHDELRQAVGNTSPLQQMVKRLCESGGFAAVPLPDFQSMESSEAWFDRVVSTTGDSASRKERGHWSFRPAR